MGAVLIQSNSMMYKRFKKILLSDITIRLDEGELLLVSGPPASGKSILIELLTGVKTPTEGSLIILDKDIIKGEQPDFSQIKCAWQKPALYPTMPLEKNLWFFSKLCDVPNRKAKKEMFDLLKSFNLFEKRKQFVTTLSLGDQKKSDLCRTLIGDSKILILDEPLLLLEQESIDVLKKILLNKKKEGNSIIIATNNADPIAEIVDKVLALKDGTPVMYQKKEVILERRENVVVLKTKSDMDINRLKRLDCLKDVKKAGDYFHLRLKEKITISHLIKIFEIEKIPFEVIKTEQKSLQTTIEEVLLNA